MRTNIIGRLLAVVICAGGLAACYVEAQSGPAVEECRNTVRRHGDVEVCKTRCNENACRTRCDEQERWSREHHCWLE